MSSAGGLHRPRGVRRFYALHAPEVECIAEGKARTPYEFGVKVSVVVTARKRRVVGMRSMLGNPYDEHTIDSALEQVEILTESTPSMVLADGGYNGVTPACGARLPISRTRKLPAKLRRLLVCSDPASAVESDSR